jgi:anaerobic magnesium-protoporphyrin IX monomethyl ester cyclase
VTSEPSRQVATLLRWRLLHVSTGRYEAQQLLDYTAVDLTSDGVDEAMRGRDEFNFSVNIQFGEASVEEARRRLVELSRAQYERSTPARAG